ncbi:hypothetical protein ACMFMF_009949 [Clarireedia jacksonii]
MATIVAGSETLTTALAGTVYLLLENLACMEKLTGIIRGETIAALPYLTAILNETMRIYPPILDSMRREVPKGGATTAGCYVPEDMVVSVACLSMFHSPSNFTSPEKFLPERWLDGSCVDDNKAAFHPFSTGPHTCIGQPLAWLEMWVILSRLLWMYEMRKAVGRRIGSWMEQKIYWTWEKSPLVVRVGRAR